MKRKALIIYCPNTESGPLSGTEVDMQNMVAFLKSYEGGCWDETNEILILPNPTKEDIIKYISREFNDVYYSLVVFSGHGYVSKARDVEEQWLEIAKNADGVKCISENDLDTKCSKQTRIINACRGIVCKPITERFFSTVTLNENVFTRSSRMLYNIAVFFAKNGINTIYSSSVGECSYCSENGSYFINDLLLGCSKFRFYDRIICTSEAIRRIGPIEVLCKNGIAVQTPQCVISNGGSAFPIAIRMGTIQNIIKYTVNFSLKYRNNKNSIL